jgi:hypothetical protein
MHVPPPEVNILSPRCASIVVAGDRQLHRRAGFGAVVLIRAHAPVTTGRPGASQSPDAG